MTYGKQAFGPHKKMTLKEKARNVAMSIFEKERHNHTWRWTDYGLEDNEPQIVRVWQALQQLRAQGAAA
jgi:hypothetical protein